MADDQSNFRTQYYKKFGLGSCEEKKSIENLLNEHPLNIDKLKHFCQFSPLPAVYRVTVWKYVLGEIELCK